MMTFLQHLSFWGLGSVVGVAVWYRVHPKSLHKVLNWGTDRYLDFKYRSYQPIPDSYVPYRITQVVGISKNGSEIDLELTKLGHLDLNLNRESQEWNLETLKQNYPDLVRLVIHYQYSNSTFYLPIDLTQAEPVSLPVYSAKQLSDCYQEAYTDLIVDDQSVDSSKLFPWAGPKGNFYADTRQIKVLPKWIYPCQRSFQLVDLNLNSITYRPDEPLGTQSV